jgi:hypothetical protein
VAGGEKTAFFPKSKGKRPLGRTKRRWENNIKMHLEGAEWMHLVQDKD